MQQSFENICRRAGGRRRYNNGRKALAFWRQLMIEHHLKTYGYTRGTLAALTRQHGVHRSTISRDVRQLLGEHPVPKAFTPDGEMGKKE